jgi:universal stress protein A
MTRLFRRILVPHDFSTAATHALRVAAKLAGDAGGRLTVLHVVVPFTPVSTLPPIEGQMIWTPQTELLRDSRRRLEALVARELGRRKRPAVTCQVVIGDPYKRIVDAARGVDSIVMATEGRTGLSHLLIGSVDEKVVRHARVPVLIIRPAARRARAARPARLRAAR